MRTRVLLPTFAVLMILVMLIAAKLAGLFLTKEEATRQRLLTVMVILSDHYDQTGRYPADNRELVAVYRRSPVKSGWQVEFWWLSRCLAARDGEEVFLDAWGNAIVYRFYDRYAGVLGAKYDLYSKGPNGVDEYGWGDDVFSKRSDRFFLKAWTAKKASITRPGNTPSDSQDTNGQ